MLYIRVFLALIFASAHSYAQVEWQSTNGPEGGTIDAVFVGDNGDIFAGNNPGSIFKSTDNGDSWSLLYGDFGFVRINEIAANSTGDLFACTNRGLFRSSDNGASWLVLENGLLNNHVFSILIPSSNSIFVGTLDGIFLSMDNGENWVEADSSFRGNQVLKLIENSNGRFFAGTIKGVFRSLDNGVSWQEKNTGLDNSASLIIRDMVVKTNDFLFIATHDGVYLSNDNGENWLKKSNGIDNDRMGAVAVSPQGQIFAGTSVVDAGIFVSTDDGDNWTQIGSSPHAVKAMAVNVSGHLFVGTNIYGIYRSIDNATIQQVNSGLHATIVIGLALNASGDLVAATNNSLHNFSSSSQIWTETPLDTFVSLRFLASKPSNGYLFVGSGGQGILRSTDGGGTWGFANNGITNLFVNALTTASNGDIFAGASKGQIFRSPDDGDNWTELTTAPGIPANAFFEGLAANASGHIFACTASHGAFRSTDNGTTWQEINIGLNSSTCEDFIFKSNGDVVVATFNGVFVSNNNGDSWADAGAPPAFFTGLAVDSNDNIYAVGEVGVWIWSATDGSWYEANDSLGKRDLNDILIQPNGNIFVGTSGAGVYRATIAPTSVSGEQASNPESFSLLQNYPNPFNPSTVISYDLDESGKVELAVFNILGHQVATLYKGFQNAGTYKISFNAKTLVAGIYIYQIKFDNQLQRRKLVLLR